MLGTLQKVFDLMRPAERRRGFVMLSMVLVMAGFETAGVASIAPFMAVLADPDVIARNQILLSIYDAVGFLRNDDVLLEQRAFLFFLGVVVFVTMLSSISFKAVTLYQLERFTQQCNRVLSREMVACYLKQPYRWFLNKHSAEIGRAVLSEVNAVNTGVLFPLINAFAYGAITIAIMIMLVAIDSGTSATVGAGLGSIYLVTYLSLGRFLTNIGEDRVLANAQRFKVIQEGFGGIKDIKFLGLENTLLGRFDDPSLRYAKHTASQHIIAKMPRFVMEVLAFGGVLLLILYLMSSYGNFQDTLPLLALYTLAAYRILPALQQVYSQVTTIRFSMPALDLLHSDYQKLNAKDYGFGQDQAPVLRMRDSLMLENVSLRYEGQDRNAISEISLKIDALTTVGFVGPTGSGKTTTVDLILGLLKPDTGRVSVDGHEIVGGKVRSWQKNLGYVPQQIYLSDDTVAANIAFGVSSEDVDIEKVVTAARVANLHEFVRDELSDGYDTKIGEQGVRLSGGQRQRIGIARALYYDPEVLVFDEATSALDNVTEKAVMEAVNSLSRDKTVILIAHRLSTVRNCDKIFVLENGGLKGEGSYEEIFAPGSRFHKMINLD